MIGSVSPLRRPIVCLALIVLYAAAIRVGFNWTEPHGLHLDEACNAWNAWCLLHSGADQFGTRWPIVAERGFDDFRSTAYLYASLPFLALGGFQSAVFRLPAALTGPLLAVLLFLLGRRLFNVRIGLVAAGLAAMMPLQFFSGVQGLEEVFTPAILAGVLLINLFAAMPLADRIGPTKPWAALLVGALTGLSLYGYAAVRVVLPALILGCGMTHLMFGRKTADPVDPAKEPTPWKRFGWLLWIAAFAMAASPLAHRHLTDPQMNRRAVEQNSFAPHDHVERLKRVALQCVLPFGPTFLLQRISSNPSIGGADGYGAIQWFWVLPLISGTLVTTWRARSSASARTLLVLLLVCPAANALFNPNEEVHPFYINNAAVPLCLLTAIGAEAIFDWFKHYRGGLANGIGLAYAAWAVASQCLFVQDAFAWKNSYVQALVRSDDLASACDQIAADVPQADAVYITPNGLVFPYAMVLTGLHYDPTYWFAESKTFGLPPFPYFQKNVFSDFGKVHVLYRPQEVASLAGGSKVVMILRPNETDWAQGHQPVGEVILHGVPRMLIYKFIK